VNAADHLQQQQQQQQHGMMPPPMPREAQRRKSIATATATTGAAEFGGTSRSTQLRSNIMGAASASASASTANAAVSQQQVLRHRILNRIHGQLHVPPINADGGGDNNGAPATVSRELLRHTSSIMDRISLSNDATQADADAEGGAARTSSNTTMNLPRPDSRHRPSRRSTVPASFGGGAASMNAADHLQQPREAHRRKTIATTTATTEAADFDHSMGTASASASTTKTAVSQQVLRHRILNRIHGQLPSINADGGKNGTPLTVSRELVRHRIMHRIHSHLRPINSTMATKRWASSPGASRRQGSSPSCWALPSLLPFDCLGGPRTPLISRLTWPRGAFAAVQAKVQRRHRWRLLR